MAPPGKPLGPRGVKSHNLRALLHLRGDLHYRFVSEDCIALENWSATPCTWQPHVYATIEKRILEA
jgi:hypothetical protein